MGPNSSPHHRGASAAQVVIEPLLRGRVEEEKIKLFCLVSVSLVVIAVALHWLGPVMVPLILAFMLSYVLSPLVDVQVQRLRVPQVHTLRLRVTRWWQGPALSFCPTQPLNDVVWWIS